MNAAQAFIAFLRVEATNAEDRARSLRATAASIEANAHEAARNKKRKRDPKAKKGGHSAYTLYVHENFEAIKKSHGMDMSSKDIMAMIGRQWSQTDEQERDAWQFRAAQLKDEDEEHEQELDAMAAGVAIAEAGLPEPPEWDSRKRPARKAPPKGMTSV